MATKKDSVSCSCYGEDGNHRMCSLGINGVISCYITCHDCEKLIGLAIAAENLMK